MSAGARRAALACIRDVMDNDAYANLTMPGILRQFSLRGADAGFAIELAYGSLRRHGWYDAVIEHAAGRDVQTIDPAVRYVLWTGVHQVQSMRVPHHAAVDQTVTLARSTSPKVAGFVNAVMRRVAERTVDDWIALLAPSGSLTDIALRHSHPLWIAAAIQGALEREGRGSDVEQALAANNRAAGITLAARPAVMTRDDLLALVPGAHATELSPLGVVMGGGDPGAVSAVREGFAGVQDEGSQIAALVAAYHDPPQAGQRWWDACAGPGGKTAIMGSVAAQHGASVDASELHEHRASLVRQAVRALPTQTVTVSTGDATSWSGHAYDRVLADVPCTGLGALRRRPEARWRRDPDDVAGLTRLQRAIATRAITALRPGGLLVYVTCSPMVEETTDVITGLEDVELEDARPTLAAVTHTSETVWGDHRWVQLWPHIHGTDAMFIAVLRGGCSISKTSRNQLYKGR